MDIFQSQLTLQRWQATETYPAGPHLPQGRDTWEPIEGSKDGALPLKPTYGLTCGRLEDETGLWPP